MIQKKVTRNRAGDKEKRMGSVTDGRKMLRPIIDIQVCHVSSHQLVPFHRDSPRRRGTGDYKVLETGLDTRSSSQEV